MASSSFVQHEDSKAQSLLLDLPVNFRKVNNRLWVEAQALNGLRLWAQNFSTVTVCAPVEPDDIASQEGCVWEDPKDLLASQQVRLVGLPWGYRKFDALRSYRRVRAILEPLVDSHRYLCFGNIGGFGAWGNIGVAIARSRSRPYSIWLDNVGYQMPRDFSGTLPNRMKVWLDREYGRVMTLRAVRHAALGLLHGKTVYDAFSSISVNPALVHDIHCGPEDAISDHHLAEKLLRQTSDSVLRIGYAGRVHPIKGPDDWIDTLSQLAMKVGKDRFQAVWYGTGPEYDKAVLHAKRSGLESSIVFAGHLSDRTEMLAAIRQMDVFLFCHRTPESPRCLIEALISGTPIVGYDSAYARDLVENRGGGLFVPVDDTQGLAAILQKLVEDRRLLKELITKASSARSHYNDVAVFRHRSELICRFS